MWFLDRLSLAMTGNRWKNKSINFYIYRAQLNHYKLIKMSSILLTSRPDCCVESREVCKFIFSLFSFSFNFLKSSLKSYFCWPPLVWPLTSLQWCRRLLQGASVQSDITGGCGSRVTHQTSDYTKPYHSVKLVTVRGETDMKTCDGRTP